MEQQLGRIARFERLGMGMFVHFGLYSMTGKGEWAYNILRLPREQYEAQASHCGDQGGVELQSPVYCT